MLIGLSLLLILTVTRSGHFGSDIKLPDASWAMFWLAGAFTVNRWRPALFMLVAGVVDYFVIAGGVSSYCVTPAYAFLIPSYLALWSAGRYVRAQLPADARSVVYVALSVLLGVSLAFVISNASFYYFSGYFATLPASTYVASVMRYWPQYLITTSIYVGCGLLLLFIPAGIRKLSGFPLSRNKNSL